MSAKIFLIAAMTAMGLTAIAVPAEAASKDRRYRSDSTSLDGRTTGRPRTCGFDTYVYDGRGIPVGPYCH